jgi:hypothetical protein
MLRIAIPLASDNPILTAGFNKTIFTVLPKLPAYGSSVISPLLSW